MKNLVLLFLLTLSTLVQIQAQVLTQTLKGHVTDEQSKAPLIGVIVVVEGTHPLLGSSTDENGNYRIPNVPLGRQVVKFSYLGYKHQSIPNVLLISGKETILNIDMAEEIAGMKEVVVLGSAE